MEQSGEQNFIDIFQKNRKYKQGNLIEILWLICNMVSHSPWTLCSACSRCLPLTHPSSSSAEAWLCCIDEVWQRGKWSCCLEATLRQVLQTFQPKGCRSTSVCNVYTQVSCFSLLLQEETQCSRKDWGSSAVSPIRHRRKDSLFTIIIKYNSKSVCGSLSLISVLFVKKGAVKSSGVSDVIRHNCRL